MCVRERRWELGQRVNDWEWDFYIFLNFLNNAFVLNSHYLYKKKKKTLKLKKSTWPMAQKFHSWKFILKFWTPYKFIFGCHIKWKNTYLSENSVEVSRDLQYKKFTAGVFLTARPSRADQVSLEVGWINYARLGLWC